MRINVSKLKDRLKGRGWNDSAFCRRAGLSKGYVSHIMSGERPGGFAFLEGIHLAFPDDDIRDYIIFESEGGAGQKGQKAE